MQILAPYPIHTVFIKTEKGHAEIAQRRFGLTNRQRRALIVMDGIKTLTSIGEMIAADELEEIISFLAAEDFIVPAEAPVRSAPHRGLEAAATTKQNRNERIVTAQPATPSPTPKRADLHGGAGPALLQDTDKIRQIKDFMTTTATTYLGLLSADVIHRIERAKGAAQLMTVVGHWHMALRESKQGSRFAGPYLEQVTMALTGKHAQLEAHLD